MNEHQWWYWAFAALAAVGLEVALGSSFVFVFFGLAALLTALAVALGLTPHLWQAASTFGALSVALLAMSRRPTMQRRLYAARGNDIDAMVGSVAVVQQAMAPGARGQVALQGTTWMAKNSGTKNLPAGMSCRVVAVDNLTLVVNGDAPGAA